MRKSLVFPQYFFPLRWSGRGAAVAEGLQRLRPPDHQRAEATYAASASNQSANLAVGTGATFLNMECSAYFRCRRLSLRPQKHGTDRRDRDHGETVGQVCQITGCCGGYCSDKKAVGSRATVIISDGGVCYDGGTWSANGTFDDSAGTFSLTLTFTDCRQYDTAINGTYSMTGA